MLTNIIRKLSIVLVAILALVLTRMGISYLTVLILIGVIMPFLSGNKKGAVFTGVLYATLSYLLSYPSGSFLINYMPRESIPISISSSTVLLNLFIGWIIPVLVSLIICGLFAIVMDKIKNMLYKPSDENTTEHYFESTDDLEQVQTDSLNKKQKKELLYLTPIQKAKNRKERNNEKFW